MLITCICRIFAVLKAAAYKNKLERVLLGIVMSIGSYFYLSFEPSRLVLYGGLCGGLFLLLIQRYHKKSLNKKKEREQKTLFLLWGIVMGLGAVLVRMEQHDVLLLSQQLNPRLVEGVIHKVTLKTPHAVDLVVDLVPEPPSFRGHLLLRNVPVMLHPFAVGQTIRARVTLKPISLPQEPGGYPTTQESFFKGIAAQGTLKGSVVVTDAAAKNGYQVHRDQLARNIQRVVAAPFHGLLLAFVFGEKGLISPQLRQAFTDSGLSHLLAISGLHMTLVAAFLFFFLRRLLSFVPCISEVYDTKKPAALLTLICLSYYLFLCFDALSARRSFLMTCGFLAHIFIGRPVLSTKNLIFSAILLLGVWPESLILPSFQMSCAAVFGLLTVYELPVVRRVFAPKGKIRRVVVFFLGIIGTTIVASLATLPLVIKNFHHVPLGALWANVLAVPLMNFCIMPLVVLEIPFWLCGSSFFSSGLTFF